MTDRFRPGKAVPHRMAVKPAVRTGQDSPAAPGSRVTSR